MMFNENFLDEFPPPPEDIDVGELSEEQMVDFLDELYSILTPRGREMMDQVKDKVQGPDPETVDAISDQLDNEKRR
jgi:hypothetical protein